ncbi:Phosphatidylglycerol/phosphatidylinositol transfer protein [Psilocybe cubensis]|uniref:Phosphatidylglycerol/phosphatidylinositol transfer protein n=2 Tax=Psilocybe cubensis TaxID=181762 RepID=A0A8H7YAV3_PSICU|nr:Phosphatidylglycerol/phosphatidylinositol transfer protein [Psilocybe cubensis]KAH9486859.1 Phosphatidylglycerol/phosphatidylinositol transfer protein [Psilocybe cubensis]
MSRDVQSDSKVSVGEAKVGFNFLVTTMRLFFLSVASLSIVPLSLALVAADQQPLQAVGGPVHTTDSWSWKNCGLETDPVQIHSISVSPDPPEPGKDLTVTVNAEVVEEIVEGAYADVTVKLGLVKLLRKQFDVCEEARNANATIQCPVKTGPYTVVQTVALPKEIPKAKFNVDVLGFTAADEDMLCVKLTVDFLKRFPRLW